MTAIQHADTGTDKARADKSNDRLNGIFLQEELNRERAAFWARAASLVIIGIWLTVLQGSIGVLFYWGLLIVFTLTGYGHYWVTKNCPDRAWFRIGLIAADFGLLAFATLTDNPVNDWAIPPPLRLEAGNFAFFFVMLVSVGLSYSAWRMIASGIVAGIAWAIGVIWITMTPGVFTQNDVEITSPQDWLQLQMDPMFVDLPVLYQQLVILGIVTGILALTVARSRKLVMQQVSLARERANLARYFPPTMVDSLAERDQPLGPVREQRVAVLFADLVGFTQWAESRAPGEVIGMLREVHARLGEAVFAHNGTLDKLMGDGLMATFGTPDPTDRDAIDAIAAAAAMQAAMDRLNDDADPANHLRLAVGVHFGPVVLGDIGSASRMEFAVLGDSVNVASRLERATREIGCKVLVSEDAAEAARRQNREQANSLLQRSSYHQSIAVPGHTAISAYSVG